MKTAILYFAYSLDDANNVNTSLAINEQQLLMYLKAILDIRRLSRMFIIVSLS
jgi:hypothetical protein